MEITTQAYKDLMASDLTDYTRVIDPLTTYRGGEYNSLVADYSKTKVAITNRLIPPYITSESHGEDIYDGLPTLLEDLRPKSILDIGCGAGELLFKVKGIDDTIQLFGVTIHVGEALHAAEEYGIPVAPADMREIGLYFNDRSLDLIVSHCSMHFLTIEDQASMLRTIWETLSPDGHFLNIIYTQPGYETVVDGIEGLKMVKKYPGFMGPGMLYKRQ